MSGASATVASGATADRTTVRAAQRLPTWVGSIRVRLAFLYSSILFVVTAILMLILYLVMAHALAQEWVYKQVIEVTPIPGGVALSPETYVNVERAVNANTLETLRANSLWALLGLFVVSLVVGWVTAGRVLAPIERITEVAREIQATDLSRRIDLGGPQDELRDLADTFDAMIGRIDEAFENQKRFIHEASHELRNPLAVIQTNLDVALSDPGASADDLRDTLEVVRRSSERMNRLVDDLLVYARQGSLSMQRESVDLSSLVHDLVVEFRTPAETRGLTLVGSAEPALLVDGDRDSLRQALANLVANAIRLAPPGSTVRVRGGSHDPWVWMSVEDEGPGIAAEDQERVFQRFWRGERGGGRSQGRSGLGLTIVRQIAEAHGGEVKLVSEPGIGSAFAIWLPRAEPSGLLGDAPLAGAVDGAEPTVITAGEPTPERA